MSGVLRQCYVCLKEFPYTEMEKELKNEWGKIIYYCKTCYGKLSIERDSEIFQSIPKENKEVSFAEKYRDIGHKVNWWDK